MPGPAAWATGLADLLLPALCPLCREADGPLLCPACRARLPSNPDPCPRCAHPLRGGDCPHCRGGGLSDLAAVASPWLYDGAMVDLVAHAKAVGRPAAVRACCALLAVPVPEWLPPGTVVVPVPPSPGRRSGPHLASALARSLASAAGLPCRRLLRASRLAAEQHGLGAADRERNVASLFAVRGRVPAGVILVDDLLTSGATASSAAAALKAAGAEAVRMVCLARTTRRP